jgi:hypothetical protein
MSLTENLESLSIPDLLGRFENDIRFGCHPTIVEATRSEAGKELQKRRKGEVLPLLVARWREMNVQSLNEVEGGVRVGITLLIQWVDEE